MLPESKKILNKKHLFLNYKNHSKNKKYIDYFVRNIVKKKE